MLYRTDSLFVVIFAAVVVAVPADPRLVIVQKLTVVVAGQPDIDLDLTCMYTMPLYALRIMIFATTFIFV